MPSGRPDSSFVAKLPSVQTSVGRMSEIWRKRWGSHDADLAGLGVAVAGRPALEDVRDEDVLARQSDALDQRGQELAGLAHERDALAVLVVARGLAHEHEVGVRVAAADHHLRAALAEGAPHALRHLVTVVRLELGDPLVTVRHRVAG